jgi:hydroxypyruvate isomerase
MQRNEGNLIAHIDLAWDEIAYFQIGDVPGRNEPGTGEINYRNVLVHVHVHGRMRKEGRDFVFGMEHGNSHKGSRASSA